MNDTPPDGWRRSSDSELRACVRRALQTYFENLQGEEAKGLFALLLSEIEVPMLQEVLEHTQGNQTQAARVLGMNRGTLRKKLSQYGLD